MAPNVPLGIASEGSFKSPDKLAPATIPVTAVKNTPNTYKKRHNYNLFAWYLQQYKALLKKF